MAVVTAKEGMCAEISAARRRVKTEVKKGLGVVNCRVV